LILYGYLKYLTVGLVYRIVPLPHQHEFQVDRYRVKPKCHGVVFKILEIIFFKARNFQEKYFFEAAFTRKNQKMGALYRQRLKVVCAVGVELLSERGCGGLRLSNFWDSFCLVWSVE